MTFKTVYNPATLIDNIETALMVRQSLLSKSAFGKCHGHEGFLPSPGLHIHLCKDPVTGSTTASLKLIKRLKKVALLEIKVLLSSTKL